MPEGDTIFRTAEALGDALSHETVTQVSATAPQPRRFGVKRLRGEQVRSVEPRGKHLLISFAPSGLVLHTHMRMTGSWHLYRHGQRWRKRPHLARFQLATEDWVAVCFSAPVCELLTPSQAASHPALRRLGPDALAVEVDLEQARRRLDERHDVSVAAALLDQGVLAGVGNVYKNELLFIHRLNPWQTVASVPGETRDALLADGVRLLRRNVSRDKPRRVTTEGSTAATRDQLYVYGKARRPCGRCHAPIAWTESGPAGRVTYWCPRCQGAPAASAAPAAAAT